MLRSGPDNDTANPATEQATATPITAVKPRSGCCNSQPTNVLKPIAVPSSPLIMANKAMHSANIGVFITCKASNAMAMADSPVPMAPNRIIIRLRSWRSASVPPNGSSNSPIADSKATMMPAMNSEPDSCRAKSGMTNVRRLTADTSVVSAANHSR